jgi:PhzF family phenazine biosynthesis protein
MNDSLPFLQVDVFTDRPFRGNPVAVVLDADGLDTAAMQRIAHWTHLSETTFVLRPTDPAADYRLRIFTPDRELPFAGHPTLGSAHAVLAAGRAVMRDGRLVQQCGAGLVALRDDPASGMRFFEVPPARIGTVAAADRAAIGAALGLGGAAPLLEAIDVGPVWITGELAAAQALLALQPDMAALAAISRRLGVTGVTLHAPWPDGHRDADGQAPTIAVRSFAPAAGVDEDPVCGSGNACVAVQRGARGRRHDYLASQGEVLGRAGRIAVHWSGDRIAVGGRSVVCVEGRLRVA